jgi:site-specific recombinase XerD
MIETARGNRYGHCDATTILLTYRHGGLRLRWVQVDFDGAVLRRAGSPLTSAGFARMIERAAAGGGLEIKAHPRMLRRACGYALANKGHDTRAIQGWLGHRSFISTAVYAALAPNRFKDFWRD